MNRKNSRFPRLNKENLVSLCLIVTILLFNFSACSDFSFYGKLDGSDDIRILSEEEVEELSIIPQSAVLPVSSSFDFSVSGGSPPFIYSIASGSGSIDSEKGIYTAPDLPGEEVVQVTDGEGTQRKAEVFVIQPGEFTISPRSLIIYVNNSITFSAIGGIKPYIFSLTSGTGTIDPDTGYFKAPSIPESSVVAATDHIGNQSEASVTILNPFSINPSSILVTTNNSYPLSPLGGLPPYTLEVTTGTGSVDSTCIYTAPSVTGEEIVTATDSAGNIDTTTITVIPPAALLISPSDITVKEGSSTYFSASGGSSPYFFSVFSGAGSIDTNGFYTAPAAAGEDIIKLSDSAGGSSYASVTIVAAGALSIIPAAALVEQGKSITFSGSGGSPPYQYSNINTGAVINASTGLYTAPAELGMDTIRITDSLNDWVEAEVTVAPAVPTQFVVNGSYGGPGVLQITWADNATGEAGFSLERKTSSTGTFSEIAVLGADTVSFVDSGLNPSTMYGYRIRAFTSSIFSSYSEEFYDTPF